MELVRANTGAAGIDRQTIADVEERCVSKLFDELAEVARQSDSAATLDHAVTPPSIDRTPCLQVLRTSTPSPQPTSPQSGDLRDAAASLGRDLHSRSRRALGERSRAGFERAVAVGARERQRASGALPRARRFATVDESVCPAQMPADFPQQ